MKARITRVLDGRLAATAWLRTVHWAEPGEPGERVAGRVDHRLGGGCLGLLPPASEHAAAVRTSAQLLIAPSPRVGRVTLQGEQLLQLGLLAVGQMELGCLAGRHDVICAGHVALVDPPPGIRTPGSRSPAEVSKGLVGWFEQEAVRSLRSSAVASMRSTCGDGVEGVEAWSSTSSGFVSATLSGRQDRGAGPVVVVAPGVGPVARLGCRLGDGLDLQGRSAGPGREGSAGRREGCVADRWRPGVEAAVGAPGSQRLGRGGCRPWTGASANGSVVSPQRVRRSDRPRR